jgi:hypothetical protein
MEISNSVSPLKAWIALKPSSLMFIPRITVVILMYCSYQQKLSVGVAISAPFEWHPNLDHGQCKLSLKDGKCADHVNPKLWKGDVQVGQVELAAKWNNGQKDANDLLEEYFGLEEHIDFVALWTQLGLDLLQPFHPGTYVGSQWLLDDKWSEQAEETTGLDVPENDGNDKFDDFFVGMSKIFLTPKLCKKSLVQQIALITSSWFMTRNI